MRVGKIIGELVVRVSGAMMVAMLCTGSALANPAAPDVKAEEKMACGEVLFGRGQFQDAIIWWQEAQTLFARKKNIPSEVRSMLRQAAAFEALGQFRRVDETLAEACFQAKKSNNKNNDYLQTQVDAARGAVCIFSPKSEAADELLPQSLAQARKAKDTALTAAILNDLGVLRAARNSPEAEAHFEEAVRLGTPLVAAKAKKNLADLALSKHDEARAEQLAGEAARAASALEDGHEKAILLVGSADVLTSIMKAERSNAGHGESLRQQAFRLTQEAQAVAEKINDQRALSYTLGAQGALYEYERQYGDALVLTRQAIQAAQQAQSPDALYRWEGQVGRLLAKQGDREAAIDACKRAVQILEGIRADIGLRRGNINAHSSFREAVGAIYLRLADLLLQRAAHLQKETGSQENEKVQQALSEARNATEDLKAAELEDFFQDACVSLYRSEKREAEDISDTALVIYIIPLEDRTEMLVATTVGKDEKGKGIEHLERYPAAVTAKELEATVRAFRLNLETRGSNDYLAQATQLYDWLIRPLEPLLARRDWNPLVFVPDGPLATVPMAALFDGSQFLIEKFPIAIIPGRELMRLTRGARKDANVLICALSQPEGKNPALTHVPQEIQAIEQYFSPLKRLRIQNDEFTPKCMAGLLQKSFTFVHVASHGHFAADAQNSYILAHGGSITLNDLELMITPEKLRDHPIDMLALSACETAAGDDRAALGLAGIAVKAGARSAMASLWSIDDDASAQLVGEFYKNLILGGPSINKAQALQMAQQNLLGHLIYRHPAYWAPYLMIGNWL